eukprot:scaffold7712_cov119-Isochrysis_galbana.AAC.2
MARTQCELRSGARRCRPFNDSAPLAAAPLASPGLLSPLARPAFPPRPSPLAPPRPSAAALPRPPDT